MRRTWQGLVLLVLALLIAQGCNTARQQLKPPKLVEEYVDPPGNDKRFTSPVEYPKDALNQDKPVYKDFTPPGAPGSLNKGTGTGGNRPGLGSI
jgi:hypothetical protein